MTTRSVRLDDIAFALGSMKLLSPEDFETGKAERTVISLPGWLFDDGRPRKRTIDVGPAGRRRQFRFPAGAEGIPPGWHVCVPCACGHGSVPDRPHGGGRHGARAGRYVGCGGGEGHVAAVG